MTILTDKDIKHIAKLSKLTLSSSEVKKFKNQLSDIVNFIKELSSVDTEGVEPTSQTTGLLNSFRDDEVEAGLIQEEAFFSTENNYSGFFKVKALLSERGKK
ncbi:MAG: Asp-tRNA(Asn)/Glu-tRNA(Gln) amidotransferase subunit GatC [Patescibacteria group bacterium]|nr:MAG: Asp-tRNA(Asn)/Glu-tRNA(Gln) amidotransferase subunit GatC [Patescibacteria group bacterium]